MTFRVHVAVPQYATDRQYGAQNEDKALRYLDDAAHMADLVLLPECSFCRHPVDIGASLSAEAIPGPTASVMSQIAVVRNCWICYSAVERADGRLFNTAVLVSADGTVAGRQRRLRLDELEKSWGLSPGDQLEVFDTHLGRIGVLLGEDARDRGLVDDLSRRGVSMVLVPRTVFTESPDSTLRTVEEWERSLRRIAIRSSAGVLWANKIGWEQDLFTVGGSRIVQADGSTAVAAGSREEIVRAVLDVAAVREDSAA